MNTSITQLLVPLQVFPYEYQRALKQLAEKEAAAQPALEKVKVEVKPEPAVRDIEESVTDTTMEKKRLEKILDKTRWGGSSGSCLVVSPVLLSEW